MRQGCWRETFWLCDVNLFLFRRTGDTWMGLLVLQAGVGNLCPELEISEASHPLLGPPVSGPELTNRSHSRKRQTSPNRNILRGQLQRKVFNREVQGEPPLSQDAGMEREVCLVNFSSFLCHEGRIRITMRFLYYCQMRLFREELELIFPSQLVWFFSNTPPSTSVVLFKKAGGNVLDI